MTETRGTSTGWRTTAVVAPAAAVAFAVATGWAVQHAPATAPAPATAATVVQPPAPAEPPFAVDRTQVSLQNRAQQLHGRVVHLERVLARLRARTHAVRQAPLPAFGGGGAQPVSGTTSVRSSGGSGSGGSVAPPPPAAAAPAPAPATHTSTGAS